MQHPQTSHCVPGKSACSRSALFPPPSPLEQLTAFNKELFVTSSATLALTRTFKTDVLKFPTTFVMGFLPRPHIVLSLCLNGHKRLQLSPEKGLNSVFFRRLATTAENEEIWGNPTKSEQVPYPAYPPLTIAHMMKTMLLHWRVVRYLSSVSGFDLFPGNWFLKCSVLLVNQATAAPKALLCELFSLASCVSCFYPPFSSYFHIKFRLLCSDPVSQHIWHPFDFFFCCLLFTYR